MKLESTSEYKEQQKLIKEKFKTRLHRIAKKLESEDAATQNLLSKLSQENQVLKELANNLTIGHFEKLKNVETKQERLLEERMQGIQTDIDEIHMILDEKLPRSLIEENNQIKSTKQSIDNLRVSISKLLGDILAKEEEKKKSAEKINSLEQELQEKTRIKEGLIAQATPLQSEVNDHTKTLTQLEEETQKSGKELASRVEHIKKLSAEIESLTNQTRQQNTELQKTGKIKREYQDKISLIESKINQARTEQEKLIYALPPLEAQFNKVQEERKEANKEIEQFETGLVQKGEQLKRVTDELRFIKDEMTHKNALIKTAHEGRAKKEEELKKYRSKMSDITAELKKKQSVLQELSKASGAFELASQEKLKEADDLFKAMTDLCSEFDQKIISLKRIEREMSLYETKRDEHSKIIESRSTDQSTKLPLLKGIGNWFRKKP